MKILATTLLSLALLAGCAAGSSAPPAGPSAAAVTGQVVWRERIMPPPQTKVIVRLQDVSLADAPARILSEAVIPAQMIQPRSRPRPASRSPHGSRWTANFGSSTTRRSR